MTEINQQGFPKFSHFLQVIQQVIVLLRTDFYRPSRAQRIVKYSDRHYFIDFGKDAFGNLFLKLNLRRMIPSLSILGKSYSGWKDRQKSRRFNTIPESHSSCFTRKNRIFSESASGYKKYRSCCCTSSRFFWCCNAIPILRD